MDKCLSNEIDNIASSQYLCEALVYEEYMHHPARRISFKKGEGA